MSNDFTREEGETMSNEDRMLDVEMSSEEEQDMMVMKETSSPTKRPRCLSETESDEGVEEKVHQQPTLPLCDTCNFVLVEAHECGCCGTHIYCKYCAAALQGTKRAPVVDTLLNRLFPDAMNELRRKTDLDLRIERGLIRDVTGIYFGTSIPNFQRAMMLRDLGEVHSFSAFCARIANSDNFDSFITDAAMPPNGVMMMQSLPHLVIVNSPNKHLTIIVKPSRPNIMLNDRLISSSSSSSSN